MFVENVIFDDYEGIAKCEIYEQELVFKSTKLGHIEGDIDDRW